MIEATKPRLFTTTEINDTIEAFNDYILGCQFEMMANVLKNFLGE